MVKFYFTNSENKRKQISKSRGPKQNRRQKVFTRGLYVCVGALYVSARRLNIENFIKSPLIYSVSYLDLGVLVLCLGVLSPPKPPMATGLGRSPPPLPPTMIGSGAELKQA